VGRCSSLLFMAEQSLLPPFPPDIQTAPLVKLSLSKLLAHDDEESGRFFEVCRNLGFFYLALDSPSGLTLADAASRLFHVGEQLFLSGAEELTRYDFKDQGSYMGYKGFGGSVLSKDGMLDANEFYNIAKDDVLGNSVDAWPQPAMMMHHADLLRSFVIGSHDIATVLLNHLDTHLQLPPGTMAGLHRIKGLSGDHVRFTKAPPQRPDFYTAGRLHMGEHTDFGSITILFNQLGGLQVLLPGDSTWQYVRPIAGHAIVNLGDALVKFSHGLLRSNLHRVVGPPGGQAERTRYSLVYFTRPEDEVLLRRLEGSAVIPPGEGNTEEAITAKEWIKRRGHARRVGIFKGEDEGNVTFKGAVAPGTSKSRL